MIIFRHLHGAFSSNSSLVSIIMVVGGPAVQWPRASATMLLSGEPDYFGRNKISSGGDLSHYSSASLY